MITAVDVLQILLTLVGAFVLFGLTVFVHELGHFLAARRKGLVVEKFAIGFGPTAWSKKIKGVEYAINWIPFGGFVQLPQMAPMEMIEGKSDLKSQIQELPYASPWARIVTAFWGPLFSFLLAFVLAVVVWVVGKNQNTLTLTTTVGYVEPGSPAAEAGIRPGDVIEKINGEAVHRWMGGGGGVREAIILSIGKQIHIDVDRDGKPLEFTVVPVKDPELEDLRSVGFEDYYYMPLVVKEVISGSPAEHAGLRPGDRIIKINGEAMYSAKQVVELATHATAPLAVTYIRDGREETVGVLPETEVTTGKKLMGVLWDTNFLKIVHVDPLTQLKESATSMWRTLHAVASPSSDVGVRHMSGPLMIFDMIMRLLRTDLRSLLAFCVFFNVNLAILNLLPIPILDGGHIVICTVEWIRRRPLDARLLMGVQTTCFVLLVSFFIFISYHDVFRIGKNVKEDMEDRKAEAAHQEPRFAPVTESEKQD